MVYAKVISTWLLIHVVSIPAFEKEFSQVKKWEKWVVRIQEIFGLQSLLEKIQSGIQKEEENVDDTKSYITFALILCNVESSSGVFA